MQQDTELDNKLRSFVQEVIGVLPEQSMVALTIYAPEWSKYCTTMVHATEEFLAAHFLATLRELPLESQIEISEMVFKGLGGNDD